MIGCVHVTSRHYKPPLFKTEAEGSYVFPGGSYGYCENAHETTTSSNKWEQRSDYFVINVQKWWIFKKRMCLMLVRLKDF